MDLAFPRWVRPLHGLHRISTQGSVILLLPYGYRDATLA